MPLGLGNEHRLTSMQGSHAFAVPKWVTSAFSDAEKISLGADRPAPGTRAEFSKVQGDCNVMSPDAPGDTQHGLLTGHTQCFAWEPEGAHSY